MSHLLQWHTLPVADRDTAFTQYKKQHGLTDEDVLNQWKQLLSNTISITASDVEHLKSAFAKASKNRAQPSLHQYSQLSPEKQQLVNILHILHAQDRQHALLSPRFDYLTVEYLSKL